MITPLLAFLLVPAAANAKTAPAAPPAVPVVWDWKYADGITSLQPGPDDSVFFDGYKTEKVKAGYGDHDWSAKGRYTAEFARGSSWPAERAPAAAGPCPGLSKNDKGQIEAADASGKVRFRAKPLGAPEWRTDRACRRFAYVSSSGLAVVDLTTFREETLGKAAFGLQGGKRVVLFASEKGYTGAYDLESGVKCEGNYGGSCEMPPYAGAPGLDRFYRPAPAVRVVTKPKSDRFEVIGANGAVLHKGEFREGAASSAQASPDGRWFAYNDDSHAIRVVDLKEKTSRAIGRCKSKSYCPVNFSAGGRFLFASPDVYEAPEFKAVSRHYSAHNSSPDDRWAVVNAGDSVSLYDLTAGTTVMDIARGGSVQDAFFSPSSRLVAVKWAQYNGVGYEFGVFELPSGRRVAAVPADVGFRAVFSPDERYFLGMRSGTYSEWALVDLRYDAQVVLRFPIGVYETVFTGSGRWLATSSGTAWRVRRGPLQRAAIAALVARLKQTEERLAKGRQEELDAIVKTLAAKTGARRTPKGEFESAAEHASRMKAADEQDALDRAEAEGETRRVAAVWDAKARTESGKAREDLEAALDEEIVEPGAVEIGAYDADAEEFDATVAVDGATRAVRLFVARKDAPAAKTRKMPAEAVYRHRLEGMMPEREPLRLAVTDNELGQVYSWSSNAGTVRRARSAPTAPAKLEVKAEFADADGDGRLAAGESAKLTVTVTNAGAGAAYGASVAAAPPAGDGLSYAARHFAGEIAPGASKTVVVPLKALDGARDGSREITVTAADANGFVSDALKVVFETRARRGARLTVAGLKVSDSGGDGVVSPGELAEIAVTVRNDGEGAAKAASVGLSGANADAFVQGESRKALGALAPGAAAVARFTVFSNSSASGSLRLRAALSDGADGWDAPVELPLGRSLGASRELVVRGKDLPAAAAAAAAEGPAARGEPRPDSYAVVLGIEDYPKAARVSHARRDAAAFRAFATGVLGVSDDSAHLFYLDDGVTLAELRKAFSPNGWLARRVGPQSDVFVFYAGHGAPSLDGKSAYLVPQDGDPNYAVETGFPIDDMLKALDGSKARSATVWLDACFSGADRESRPLLADARPLSVTVAPVVPPGKVALFSAASGSQVSSAFPAKNHGLFTWFALRGLDGEADADKNGALTAGELADFLGARVPREAGAHDREQTPGFRGDRERTLVRFRKAR